MEDKQRYHPVTRIVVEENSKMPTIKKTIRPNLQNLLERIVRINELTGGARTEVSDLQTILDDIIDRLENVPYIPYPVSLSTVDMIGIKEVKNGPHVDIYVLLGKKYKQTQWQFPGGFRDPSETSAQAAAREFHEEACLPISPERFRDLGDMFVDDRRYKDTPHKITTSMYLVHLMDDEVDLVMGGDDLEMVQWFKLDELRENKNEWMRQIHHRIFDFVFNNSAFI